jgi:hypothetical protein
VEAHVVLFERQFKSLNLNTNIRTARIVPS